MIQAPRYIGELFLLTNLANQIEKYRLSAIFYLQACEQTFKNAEKLAKKHDLGVNFYKSQIEKADSVLNLYYLE